MKTWDGTCQFMKMLKILSGEKIKAVTFLEKMNVQVKSFLKSFVKVMIIVIILKQVKQTVSKWAYLHQTVMLWFQINYVIKNLILKIILVKFLEKKVGVLILWFKM